MARAFFRSAHVLAFAMVIASCARTPRPRTPAVTPVPASAGTVAQRAVADSMKRIDSLKRADSARVADSTTRAAVRPGEKRTDSARVASMDSLRKATRKTPARAASRECIMDMSDSPPETRLTLQTLGDGSRLSLIGGGVIGHCQGQNNRISADSAEFYETAGLVNFYGNVQYLEVGKMRFQSARATYFTREDRLVAEGNVQATQLASGSTFNGPTIEYLRPKAGVRTESRLTAPGRPTVRIIEHDSTKLTQPPPVVIQANTIVDVNDSLIYAWGSVNIDRYDIVANSDSSTYNKVAGESRLVRNARIISHDQKQGFQLNGDTIQMFNRDRNLDRVVALSHAVALSGNLDLRSEKLDLRLNNRRLERAFAFGAGTSKAHTPQQDLEADSLAIFMREQRVREVRALGKAVAKGVPDSTRIRTDERDMLRGDTVVALFDTLFAPGDTTTARVREIHAIGNASSYFLIADKRGAAYPPGYNYARGKTITITLDSGLSTVRVDSSASGIYLEPDSLADSTTKKTPPRKRVPAASSATSHGDLTRAPFSPYPWQQRHAPGALLADAVFTMNRERYRK